ncbi:uncharacterized protein LOC108201178 [Daucus carota subsp. sativus]|uniref:uncharacterized protein LOC108201178 n=1 Tax=Daucus carota subsp. sativus TaxID=79200 RepID=UPI0007EFC73E|nr:PREDICTED: uncharacterized protein LOC108201178 [Daucus carota subsp. sativus]
MTTDELHQGNSASQDDNPTIRQMAETIRKLQADMDAQRETWRSEREALQRELTTARSKSTPTARETLADVSRRLNMDDGEEEEYDEEIEAEPNPNEENPEANDRTETETPSGGPDNGGPRVEERKKDGTKKKRSHKSTKSRSRESMRKELQALKEMVQRIPGMPKPLEKAAPMSYADSPFCDNIALVETPKRFAVPPMKAYDGTTDPQEHVAQYKQRMFTVPITKELREPCMCKGFGSTLAGPALQWYVSLPNGSIETFADLVDAFNLQFASSRVFEKTTSDLYKIVQGFREPLRDYLTRFNREKVTITNCDTPTAVEAFRRGLERDSPLYDELTKYPCKTLDDVQAKAMAQVRLEEDKRERDDKYYRPNCKILTTRAREYKPYSRDVRDTREDARINSTQEYSDWRKDPNLPPTYDSYGFTITPSAMMREFTKLGDVVKWPVKSNKPKANPDSKLWCDFHGDYGHKASDCVALRRELQYLTKKGYLTEFMPAGRNTHDRKDKTSPKLPPPPPYQKVINFIAGGSEVCGSTYSQAKRMARRAEKQVAIVSENLDETTTLTFDARDKEHVKEPQQDSLVISLPVGNCLIKRIMVDNGSAANIMMKHTLQEMGLAESDMIKRSTTLVGFSGETKKTMGEITLPTYAQGVNVLTKFLIIDCDSTYNIIMGRPWIHELQAVPSTVHQVIKFPTPWGVQQIKGDQATARECYKTCMKPTVEHELQASQEHAPTITGPEKLTEITLDTGDKKVLIGEDLSPSLEANLVDFLTTRLDAFAWEHEDITGISPDVITHKLNVDPSHKPIQQRRRKFAAERNKIINEEVSRLLKAGMIREVDYPEWLANVVIVQKKNGKWRVCVDYTDLNKACPKDPFPLPHIDTMVDSTAGHELLTFLDASSGFNQIQMDPSDAEKTAFVTERGIYCYLAMPFGLRNASATFQRLVNKMFKEKIGDTMEVYIDDMVVKSLNAEDHVKHLEEVFDILRQYNMKLNPQKCNFAVSSGKFLGHMVTRRGIEASPEQIKAVQDLTSPSNIREVQRLTGRVAALNRFISRSSDRCRPFYNVLRRNKGFTWTDEHEKALLELKQYLTSPPLLAKSTPGEDLYLYLSVTSHAVSSVLVKLHEGIQSPVYYTSKSLIEAETRYTPLEKLVLALTMTSTKLRHYFETHKIHVLTNFPLRTVLSKPELTGRMAKWAIKLSTYDIVYEPRTAIKSQALADFVADFSPNQMAQAEEELQRMTTCQEARSWTLYTDGASNANGTGLGLVLKSPQGDKIVYSVSCEFKATNNEAEYEALIVGLTTAKDMKVKHIDIYCDSLLIVNQINGSYEAKDPKMLTYLDMIKKLQLSFDTFNIQQVPRESNTQADALAGLGSVLKNTGITSIPIVHIMQPASLRMKEQLALCVDNMQTDDVTENWMQPFKNYLQHGTLPANTNEARILRMKASRFTLVDDVLFKKSITGLLQRCLRKQETDMVLRDLHDGECGNHTSGRSLSMKVLRMGYYWPTVKRDAEDYVRRCDACQKHAPVIHQPSEELHATMPSWPFMKWGMDIVGKMPPAPGQKVYMLVMTDYFSKWIEAEAFRQVTSKEVVSFIKRNILCKFGIPSEIICDNGSQFISDKTEAFCKRYNITLVKSTPRYPQANGQAESSNKILMNNLKRRLSGYKGRWAEELPWVLWSDRTTPKTSTGQTPFSLVYGTEAVLPTEVMMPTARYGLVTGD